MELDRLLGRERPLANELIQNLGGMGASGASDVNVFGFRGMNTPHVMPTHKIPDRLTSLGKVQKLRLDDPKFTDIRTCHIFFDGNLLKPIMKCGQKVTAK